MADFTRIEFLEECKRIIDSSITPELEDSPLRKLLYSAIYSRVEHDEGTWTARDSIVARKAWQNLGGEGAPTLILIHKLKWRR